MLTLHNRFFFYSINGFKTKGTHGSTYLTFNFKQIQTHIKTFKINASNFSTYIYIHKPSCLLSVNKNSIKQFTWAAMTCCLWTTSRQLPQTQSFHGQFFLWPLKTLITPWFLHLAHLGVLSLFFSTTFGIYGQWWLQVLKVF